MSEESVPSKMVAVLRVLSGLALGFAVVSAAGIVALDALHWLRPDLPWRYKSALSLIGIGTSFALLQFTLPRARRELALGLTVSLGFLLWGAEQFVTVPRIASLIDDAVVCIFVMDLGIVIGRQLRRSLKEKS